MARAFVCVKVWPLAQGPCQSLFLSKKMTRPVFAIEQTNAPALKGLKEREASD